MSDKRTIQYNTRQARQLTVKNTEIGIEILSLV